MKSKNVNMQLLRYYMRVLGGWEQQQIQCLNISLNIICKLYISRIQHLFWTHLLQNILMLCPHKRVFNWQSGNFETNIHKISALEAKSINPNTKLSPLKAVKAILSFDCLLCLSQFKAIDSILNVGFWCIELIIQRKWLMSI